MRHALDYQGFRGCQLAFQLLFALRHALGRAEYTHQRKGQVVLIYNTAGALVRKLGMDGV